MASFHSRTKFSSEKIFHVLKLIFSLTSPFTFWLKVHFLQLGKVFLHRTFYETNKPTLDCIFVFHPKLMEVILFGIETCFFMIQHAKFNFPFKFQIWYLLSKFQFCTWNSLFGLHHKCISFSIKSSHIFLKLGHYVQNISKFILYLSDCSNTLNFWAIFMWLFTYLSH